MVNDPTFRDAAKIHFAYGAAQHFVEIAQIRYKELNDKYLKRKSGENISLFDNPGELAPLFVNLSFALELLLKVLRIQHSLKAPRGHNLYKLWEPLDDKIKSNLQSRYLSYLNLSKSKNNIPYLLVKIENTVPGVSTEPSDDIISALKNMRKSFEQWRYMYEIEDISGQFLYHNFHESYALVKSINDEIQNCQGSAYSHLEVHNH